MYFFSATTLFAQKFRTKTAAAAEKRGKVEK
jgi:hypothetical protein